MSMSYLIERVYNFISMESCKVYDWKVGLNF